MTLEEYNEDLHIKNEKEISYSTGYNTGYESGDKHGFERGDKHGFERGDKHGFDRGKIILAQTIER